MRLTSKILAGMLLNAAIAAAPEPLFSVENLFVQAWTDWKPLREAAAQQSGTISAAELRAWRRVQEQWKILNRYMEHQH